MLCWRTIVFLFAIFCIPTMAHAAGDPELTLSLGTETKVYTRSELLKRGDVQTLEISHDPAYPGQTMTYKAVPAAELFKGMKIPDDAVIQFKCLDGFSAPISKERLLNAKKDLSVAFVAIEEEGKPWPALKAGSPSAGPFYLVWPNPKPSAIGPEEWPFQLAAFEVKGTFESVYPQVLPDKKLKPDDPARKGFAVFAKNCFACHTLNKAGAANVGPDLNVPMNPTEYFTKDALKKLIRDPQSLRHFPNSRMSAFPATVISDQQLTELLAYLTHMSKHKIKK